MATLVSSRLKELDAIRGLAALFVVLYHYTYRYYEIYPSENKLPFSFEIGHYGVQAFFIVSGFVIFMTLEKTTRSLDFVVHRFIRLYPAYWISVFITFFLVALLFSLPGRETTFLEFLANLSMVHTQFAIPSVDGVYWTLLFELKFYSWMLLLYQFKFLNKIEFVSIGVLSIALFSNLFGVDKTLIYKIANQAFIFEYISYFISGIMFYKIYSKHTTIFTYIALGLALLTSLYINHFDYTYVILIIYIIFFLLAFHKLKLIAWKPLFFLWSISYALYLIHQNIGYIILYYGYSYGFSVTLATLLTLSVSIFIASLITLVFEKRTIKYLRKKYDTYCMEKCSNDK